MNKSEFLFFLPLSDRRGLERLQADADKLRKLDWEVHYVDGTVIRAHQHATGGKKGAK